MIRQSLIAFGLLASACSGAPESALPAREDGALRIAAWNIEHLTAELGAGCAPRGEEGLDLVADYIARIDADIWLLQEIDGAAALERVFGPGWTFHVEERRSSGDYPLCRGRDDGSRLRSQNTSIAIRDGIAHERLPDFTDLDVNGTGRMRYGVAITVQGEEPIDVMSVHLASGCHQGDTSNVCPTLFGQAEALETWIDNRSAAGRPVIFGGDFNRRFELPGDQVWDGLNDGTPYALHIAGPGIRPRCDPRYSEFIDFIVLNEHAHRRKIEGSFQETTFVESRELRPSDHCPISVEIR